MKRRRGDDYGIAETGMTEDVARVMRYLEPQNEPSMGRRVMDTLGSHAGTGINSGDNTRDAEDI